MRSSQRIWGQFSQRLFARHLCSDTKPGKPTGTGNNGGEPSSFISREEAYEMVKKKDLDFTTASKILFNAPPKRKEFGLDFHLVQLFFVCLPSFAVYLVAQYARSEMRRMDAELEVKKKAEEDAKLKEMELKAAEEEEKKASDPHLLEVKERLEKLEEAVKEFAVSKKTANDSKEIRQPSNDAKPASSSTDAKPASSSTDAKGAQ